MTANGDAITTNATRAVASSSVMMVEILGFLPQLLLDDIANAANEAVVEAVNGTEVFIQRWADNRDDQESIEEVESGLAAFQTLLEFHSDTAFDYFEIWALKNIFGLPPGLPMVMPHHKGLDLVTDLDRQIETEKELLDEIEMLRTRIDEQRALKKLQTRALRAAKLQAAEAKARLSRYSFLNSPALDTLASIPSKLVTMHTTVSSHPPLNGNDIAALTQFRLADPGKRQWETSKTGYLNWAVESLLTKTRREEETSSQNENGTSSTAPVVQDEITDQVGSAASIRSATESIRRLELH